ncbi:MAG: hypothetical protein ACR2JB_18170 [Bryobacteraceae bacterium]
MFRQGRTPAKMTVVRVVFLLFVATFLLLADTFKLYLKDGDYHLVREYQVSADRVRYYSTERGDWEEIPKELVDLDKTEKQRSSKQDDNKKEAQANAEEEQAERALRRQIAAIPAEAGTYYEQGDRVKALTMADYKVITDKKRQALKALSPVPLIPGKASVVIQGDHSSFIVNEERPEFFFRLAKQERFGIVRLTPKKTVRVVENIAIIPVSKENIQEQKQVETFQQELASGLYKVWPEKPLTPGEYAVVEYSEGQVELLIWDFAYRRREGPAQAAAVKK